MSDSFNHVLSAAVMTLLKPLVRILLRNGVMHSAFDELVKKTYVDVAYQEFALSGKKQTTSRVSALTGLTRKEVKRLLEIEDINNNKVAQKYDRPTRVISGWVNDPEFSTAGQAKQLDIEAFNHLVKRYSGDIPSKAMQDLLLESGNISLESSHISLIKNAYIPCADDVAKIKILGNDCAELLETINHNIITKSDDLRLQRKVSNCLIRHSDMPNFQRVAEQKSQKLLEELNSWLGQHEISYTRSQGELGYVSVGVYYYQKD